MLVIVETVIAMMEKWQMTIIQIYLSLQLLFRCTTWQSRSFVQFLKELKTPKVPIPKKLERSLTLMHRSLPMGQIVMEPCLNGVTQHPIQPVSSHLCRTRSQRAVIGCSLASRAAASPTASEVGVP